MGVYRRAGHQVLEPRSSQRISLGVNEAVSRLYMAMRPMMDMKVLMRAVSWFEAGFWPVRQHSTKALRTAAEKLTELANYMEKHSTVTK